MNIADITPEYLKQNGIETKNLIFSSRHLPYNPRLKTFSRKMRRDGELAEALLWRHLKAKQTGYVFNRQKPILNFIADFYCKELSLVVEIDGLSHFSEEAHLKDEERDRQMQVVGLHVIRVLDSDVRKNPEHVVRCIMESVLSSPF
ncbi:MAG: endonuclease domain-containing protein [Bacteroidales bacterium]|nr:endonuclease domain-containing protein [Bacteroidales bacterium]